MSSAGLLYLLEEAQGKARPDERHPCRASLWQPPTSEQDASDNLDAGNPDRCLKLVVRVKTGHSCGLERQTLVLWCSEVQLLYTVGIGCTETICSAKHLFCSVNKASDLSPLCSSKPVGPESS